MVKIKGKAGQVFPVIPDNNSTNITFNPKHELDDIHGIKQVAVHEGSSVPNHPHTTTSHRTRNQAIQNYLGLEGGSIVVALGI